MVWAWCFGYCQAHRGLPAGFFCSCIQFYLLLSPYLCFISFLYLDLYVLGDDALRSYGSFIQTKHLCALIHIWTKGVTRYAPKTGFLATRPNYLKVLHILYKAHWEKINQHSVLQSKKKYFVTLLILMMNFIHVCLEAYTLQLKCPLLITCYHMS